LSLKGNTTVEEIRLGGNTLGIEACRALGEILKSNRNLKVYLICSLIIINHSNFPRYSKQMISLLVALFPRSQMLSPPSSPLS
jgi:Ran GTPase-activating protein (RanGAP) involved in mRNA processing and transport